MYNPVCGPGENTYPENSPEPSHVKNSPPPRRNPLNKPPRTWLTVYFDLCCFFPNYCFAAVVLIATNRVEYIIYFNPSQNYPVTFPRTSPRIFPVFFCEKFTPELPSAPESSLLRRLVHTACTVFTQLYF